MNMAQQIARIDEHVAEYLLEFAEDQRRLSSFAMSFDLL